MQIVLDTFGHLKKAEIPTFRLRGGGTLVVAGSHRLVQECGRAGGTNAPWRSADVRKALEQADPWFKALCSKAETVDRAERFMKNGAVVRGVSVRVVLLTLSQWISVPACGFDKLWFNPPHNARTSDRCSGQGSAELSWVGRLLTCIGNDGVTRR